jgi:DNA-binding CsgD family transcriptional regulator
MTRACPFSWISSIGTAVWATDPDGVLAYANPCARSLLSIEGQAQGEQLCHTAVRGVDAQGGRYCGTDCATRRLASSAQTLATITLECGAPAAQRRWLRIIPVAAREQREGPAWIVHCAVDVGQARRLERYLASVAAPSHGSAHDPEQERFALLTAREREILSLLEGSANSRRVAYDLHVSYATVRNHIQHILAKLQVHSIQEALAVYILADEPGR